MGFFCNIYKYWTFTPKLHIVVSQYHFPKPVVVPKYSRNLKGINLGVCFSQHVFRKIIVMGRSTKKIHILVKKKAVHILVKKKAVHILVKKRQYIF